MAQASAIACFRCSNLRSAVMARSFHSVDLRLLGFQGGVQLDDARADVVAHLLRREVAGVHEGLLGEGESFSRGVTGF